MKKGLAQLLVVVLVCSVMFMGCGKKDSSVEGTTWAIASAIDAEGTEVTGEELATVYGDITYEFQKDGVLLLTAGEQSLEGTWSQDGKEVTIDAGGQTTTATVDGKTMTAESEAGTVTFEKQ
ncbi:MAG TPA: hypothetical protein VHQ24_07950 [Lachnospiraceae bacterium]|nr:hypothetical protein [Lachnospiraceae bacterium]HEX3076778.1 hypothetical protein [Lachnospiraceae bacterium]